MPTDDDLKAEANAAYAAGAFESAVNLYTRSAAFVGLKQFTEALKDATACVKAEPAFIKGYSREGFAHAALHQPGSAEAAYRLGLSKDANNAGLKQGLAAILQDDGDQRPLLGKAWQPVLDKMNDVGLKFGLYMSREPDQQLIRAMMTADISQLRAQFEPELLYYRALPNRLSMAALAVSLVQRLQMQMPRPEAIRRFTPVIGFWLDQGARINAKDIGGQTALHLAVMFDPILPLAEFLLQRGADINAQTRTGATPMLMSVQAFEEESVKLLLKWGADLDIKDHAGMHPVKMAQMHPRILALLHQHQGLNAEAQEQYSHRCAACAALESRRRCNNCRLVIYCSPKCQKAHWKSHKPECIQLAAQHLRVDISLESNDAGLPAYGKYWTSVDTNKTTKYAADRRNGVHRGQAVPTTRQNQTRINVNHNRLFSVKIQVAKEMLPGVTGNIHEAPFLSPEELERQFQPSKIGPMFCYNESKDFCCWIGRQQHDSEKLVGLISEKGVAGGAKAYFKAFVDQTTKQLVVLPTMLPVQVW